jgi:hypothetical protein
LPGEIAVIVSPSWASPKLEILRLGVNRRREKTTNKAEKTSHSVTNKVRYGTNKDIAAMSKAAIPIIKATKAVGKTSSIKQRTIPAIIQRRVRFSIDND